MAISTFPSISFETFTPRYMLWLGFEAMRQSAEIGRLIAPWPDSRNLREFQNKLEAFNLFAHVDSVLGISSPSEFRWPEAVRRIDALEPYRAVWCTEGLGYYLTVRRLEQAETARGLLKTEAGEIPENRLIALHAGMGLALADRVLTAISPEASGSEIRQALLQFVEACRDNSIAEYVGAAHESLGLITRSIYPQLVSKVDLELGELGQGLLSYFWHGVGRGIYFAPTNLWPDHHSHRALKQASTDPPHELGRRSALAGLSWATTLVNIRHPEILESFVKHNLGQLRQNDAFVNGVNSAIMVWRDSTVDDPCLAALCSYQPDGSDRATIESWEQLVRRPCLTALESVYPSLKAGGGLGTLFRYRPNPE